MMSMEQVVAWVPRLASRLYAPRFRFGYMLGYIIREFESAVVVLLRI